MFTYMHVAVRHTQTMNADEENDWNFLAIACVVCNKICSRVSRFDRLLANICPIVHVCIPHEKIVSWGFDKKLLQWLKVYTYGVLYLGHGKNILEKHTKSISCFPYENILTTKNATYSSFYTDQNSRFCYECVSYWWCHISAALLHHAISIILIQLPFLITNDFTLHLSI